ncbi:MAG TPA: hypothetical protein VND64_01190 [Pirellulales bacterium]|nr:hypothetical protein [Pirellulales bacterium]
MRHPLRFAVRPIGVLTNTASGTGLLVVLGLALRMYHYLRGPSLWHDEAALVINVVQKGFGELLGPLFFSEAAPPLFLWLERAVSLLFGDGVFALRLVPLAASCLSLILMVPLARYCLAPASVGWCILLFACSDRLLWHACEAKQYSVEACLAVALLVLYFRTAAWPLARRLVLFALLAPATLWLAYPGCFLYGALLLAFLSHVRKARRPAAWMAYGLMSAAVFGSFALLVAGPMQAQRDQAIVECWQGMRQFPDWRRPASVPLWTVQSTLDLVGYVCKPIGPFLAPLGVVGIVSLWRRGARDVLLLLSAPIGLGYVASCFHRYPYGGMRVMVYASPAIVLLVAAGVPPALDWLRARRPITAVALTALLLVPLARAAYYVAVPWPRANCAAAADYVTRSRLPSDQVVSNHWEYLYYFRKLGPAHLPMDQYAPPAEGRVWVVVTGATPADRKPCLDLYQAGDWQMREHRDFERTTVLLVEKKRTTVVR